MSAHTRQSLQIVLGALADLFATAVDLIRRDKRSQQSINALLLALQLFKQNLLAGVVERATGEQVDIAKLAPALSMEIEDTGMSARLRRYLQERGVRYVGEICYMDLDPRAAITDEIQHMLVNELGVPLGIDPVALGWQPPYWNEGLTRILNQPTLAVLSERGWRNFRRAHGQGHHYAGSVLRKMRNWYSGQLFHLQKSINEGSGIHAAMLVPSDWTAPDGVPAAYIEWRAKQPGWRGPGVTRMLDAAGMVPRLVQLRARMRELGEAAAYREFCEQLECSVRLANCLREVKITTLRGLLACSLVDLLRTKNFGRKTVQELDELLGDYGLHVEMSEAEIRKALDGEAAA